MATGRAATRADRRAIMAKGQKRSGREPKKPKQQKPKALATAHSTTPQDLIKTPAQKAEAK
jgi:hypothetical protein